jgi:oligopeptidase B
MKSRIVLMSWFASAALPALGAAQAPPPTPRPAALPSKTAPIAKKVPHMQKLHGDELADPYFWMRDRENPEVKAYLEKENAYTDAFMKPTEAFQKALYDEMLGRIKETDLTVPYRDRGYFYYSRTEKGKQYSIYCRKKGSLDAAEQVILDVDELAKGQRFMSVGARAVTDDARLLAYTTDNTGFRDYTLWIKDLETGKLLPEKMERVTSVAWAPDNKTLFYATTDHAKRPHRIWRHTVGTDPSSDVLLYEEKDERFRVGAYRSRSRTYIFFPSSSHTTSEWRYVPAATPAAEPRLIAPRIQEQEYSVDHRGDLFYIVTNDKGRNNRLVSAPVSNPGRENWTEIVPHRDDVMLEDIDLFKDWTVLYERQDALPRIRVSDAALGNGYLIEFPEAIYSAGPENNREFDTQVLRYEYESFTTPPSVYDFDMATKDRKLLKQREVPGYDPSLYTSERRYATASDGTKIPISLVYRKGFVADGKAPMLLTAYGSYGASNDANFDSTAVSLLDRGVVCAVGHIRGGGDLGKKWHDEGRMLKKKNSFTDFIAVAETLVADKYTSSDRLVIEGGSAGGLLMGAVVNMRPDLFQAVVSRVPFVDVINSMYDESLPLTVGEFEEWGNPKIPEQYVYMKSYSPYDNLEAKAYPAMLVKTSFDDSQVMYWEPAKYVARLRTLKTDSNPLIFKINMAGGHGGSSGRYDKLREVAFDYAFELTQMGITK